MLLVPGSQPCSFKSEMGHPCMALVKPLFSTNPSTPRGDNCFQITSIKACVTERICFCAFDLKTRLAVNMHFFSVFLITLFPIIGLLPLHISSQDSSPSILKSTEVKNVTKEHSEQDTKTTGLLGRLFNMVQVEKERPFIPVSENCTLPSLRESMIKNIEYQYFCYRIKTDGMVRFDLLRQRVSSITSYSELRHILFPAPTEYKHPFFNCAFDMFFNHFMNRTPYVWLHWIDFDGSRFPFVWWQKVNV